MLASVIRTPSEGSGEAVGVSYSGCLFFAFSLGVGFYLVIEPVGYLGFIYNKNWFTFTLRGKNKLGLNRLLFLYGFNRLGAATPTQMARCAYFFAYIAKSPLSVIEPVCYFGVYI